MDIPLAVCLKIAFAAAGCREKAFIRMKRAEGFSAVRRISYRNREFFAVGFLSVQKHRRGHGNNTIFAVKQLRCLIQSVALCDAADVNRAVFIGKAHRIK